MGRVCGVAVALFSLWIMVSTGPLVHRAESTMDHYVEKLTLPLPTAALGPVPATIADALIASEDKNFYSHHGVDWEAERHSLSEDIRSVSLAHGGSTITMQAVRYTMLPYSKTPARKIAQILLALQLDDRLSKPQILRLYVDSVNFGLHAAGLQRAAKIYFNKRPEKLSLAECAFLAGAISHPPKSKEEVTPEFVHARMDPALAHMEPLYAARYTPEAFDSARQETLHFAWDTDASDPGLEAHK
jgi:membrane peptidoglycan carboxypeptidase